MKKIGIIADDLTGATTVGVLLARSDIKTAAYFSPEELVDTEDKEAIVLSSNSRHLAPDKAKEAVRNSFHALKEAGAGYFSKRIDTTLRGGIGYEIDEMLENISEEAIGVMVPAMPQSNRILVGGYSVIDGTALSKTDVAKDVLTPIKETHVPTMLEKQTKHKIGQLGLSSLLAGKEAVKAALIHQKFLGKRIIICDSISIDDISLIAEAVVELQWEVLAIDPGPFTQQLALHRGCGNVKPENQISEDPTLSVDGKVLVVAGSATDVTKKQMTLLCENESVSKVSINPNAVAIEGEQKQAEEQMAIHALKTALQMPTCHVVVLESAVSGPVLNLEEVEMNNSLEKGQAAKNINQSLSTIVKNVLDDGIAIDGLYMTGGDTMVSTLTNLDARGISLIDYIIPQTDLGRIIGGKFDGLVTVGKGGLTGKSHTAISAVNRIAAEAKKVLAKV